MTLLEKIAAEVSPDLGGVDWDALELQLGIPREEVVYHTAENTDGSGVFLYQAYIKQAFDRAEIALSDVQLTWQVEADPATAEDDIALSMEAWKKVKEETISIGDNVLHALRTNIEFLSGNNAFEMNKELLRAMISSTYMTNLYGALAHAKAMMQLSDVAPEDIINSADNITKTFNALAMMANMGVLNPLKRTPAVKPPPETVTEDVVIEGTSGVPVAVLIVIGAVLAIGLIAWCIVEVIKQQATNRAIQLVCEDAVRSGDEDAQSRCIELVKLNKTAQNGGPLGDLALSLGQAALMVGISYAAFMLIPPLARMFKRRESRV